jgi:hypothetical protein
MKALLSLIFGKSVDSILADLSRNVKALRDARESHLESGEDARLKAQLLLNDAQSHVQEAARAERVANKLADLIA